MGGTAPVFAQAGPFLEAAGTACSCVAPRKNRGARAQPAIVGDHAETERQSKPGLRDGSGEVLSRELAYRFHEPEKTGRATGLTHGQLATAGVERERPVGCKSMPPDELRPGAFRA